MRKHIFNVILIIGISVPAAGQLKPGDEAINFTMSNIDGKQVSLSDYSTQKGVILVFICNACPFVKAYEPRMIKLHNNLASFGYPLIAINPNDEKKSPDDTLERMKEHAQKMKYPFEYLKDESEIFKAYGATRTPEFFLLKNDGKGKFKVVYIGALDNNAMDAKSVSERYIDNAIVALQKGAKANPDSTEALGCTIKAD